MRIPFFVSGYQVTPDNLALIARWCDGHVVDAETPFVRVPVSRATHERQTKAYPGTWVIVSLQRGQRSFKVYTQEWLDKQFIELPDEPIDEGIPELDRPEDFETRTGTTREIDAARYRTPSAIPVQFRPATEQPYRSAQHRAANS